MARPPLQEARRFNMDAFVEALFSAPEGTHLPFQPRIFIEHIPLPLPLGYEDLNTLLGYIRSNRQMDSYLGQASVEIVVRSEERSSTRRSGGTDSRQPVGRSLSASVLIQIPDGQSYEFSFEGAAPHPETIDRMSFKGREGYELDRTLAREMKELVDSYFVGNC